MNLHGGIIKENGFDERPTITFLIKPQDFPTLKKDIRNASKDRCSLKKIEENLFL
ncbi:MAG: hypothetical protein U5K00_13575 [Melioribacteraceae bacterium]|nr:hypothetical protein [Melioribacteraceae bacterium]